MGNIQLRDVNKSFGSTTIIPRINLDIDNGEFVVFVGPSGCGKSTLLRLIAGLEDTTSGKIMIDGRDVTDEAPARRKLAMVFQSYALYPHMTVAKNIAFPLKMAGEDQATIDRNAEGKSSAKALSADIAALSARIVRSTARTRQRFSATEAYAQIVFERINELREAHVGDCQRLGVFIERRFRPTVRYCVATDQRLVRLGQSVANLGDLLQARVQVEVEEQNSEILRSLNARADTQIKIQKAVEGLSIIAISYYLLSLFKLFYGGLHSLGLDVSARTAILVMTPVVVLILGAIFLRIRKAKGH